MMPAALRSGLTEFHVNNSDRSAPPPVFLSPAGVIEAATSASGVRLRWAEMPLQQSICSAGERNFNQPLSQSECNGFALHPARDKGARLAAQRLAGRALLHTRQSFHRSGLYGRAPRRVAGRALRSISRRQFFSNV
jgi:hypothetical protein